MYLPAADTHDEKGVPGKTIQLAESPVVKRVFGRCLVHLSPVQVLQSLASGDATH